LGSFWVWYSGGDCYYAFLYRFEIGGIDLLAFFAMLFSFILTLVLILVIMGKSDED